MSHSNMRRASLAEIRRMKDAGELATDIVAAEPEQLAPEFWKDAKVAAPREESGRDTPARSGR